MNPNEKRISSYVKTCNKLSEHYINLGFEFKLLSISIKKHGITDDIKKVIRLRINKIESYTGMIPK